MIWFSFLLFFVIMAAGISFDFSILGFDFMKLLDFLDLPSLVIVVFPAIFFGIASTSWKSYWHCWSYPFSTRKEVTADNAQSAARCLKVMGDSGFLMGIVGTFIGAVLILRNSEAIEDIGTAVSVALITLFTAPSVSSSAILRIRGFATSTSTHELASPGSTLP